MGRGERRGNWASRRAVQTVDVLGDGDGDGWRMEEKTGGRRPREQLVVPE